MAEKFVSALQELVGETEVQQKAWDHFLELGLPDKKSDAFKYVPLQKLYDDNFQKKELKRDVQPILENYLVFVDGSYIPELSSLPKKVVALSLDEAMRSYGPLLQGRLSKTLKEERDPLAVLNLAIHQRGLFFYVPPKEKIGPIQALFFSSGGIAPSRLQIFLGMGSELTLLSTIAGEGLHHNVIDVALEDGAHFEQIDVPYDGKGWNLNFLRATLKRDSQLKHLAITQGRMTRQSLKVTLNGENSNALLQGLWNLKGSTQAHTHVVVEHAAPHAHSLQKYKGVLDGTSQSSFEGKIYVHPIAQKTQAYQLNKNLLLSPGAIANAKPNLEIFADDVKASHGATTSQLSDEELFYLKSRGLSQETAKRLLIRGFMQEMIDQIPKVMRDVFA